MKVFLIIFLIMVLTAVMFLMMDDFEASKTSLVKRYWGGSFQCIAYVQKYYKDSFGIEIKNVGRAQEMYNKAPDFNLYSHRNGGVTAPQPGDILVFGHRNNVGHVAIITGVIKEGVLIVEQNWGTSRITTNGGQPLPMRIDNGSYIIEDRASYNVIGWVSRTLNNPGTLFDFSPNSPEGWIVETDTKNYGGSDEQVWTIGVSGAGPTIVSPIYTTGIKIGDFEKVVVRARIRGNENPSNGKLYLRDGNDQWSTEVPLTAGQSIGGFTEYEADLSSQDQNGTITQLKLRLSDPSLPRMESWDIDWLRFIPKKVLQFPVD